MADEENPFAKYVKGRDAGPPPAAPSTIGSTAGGADNPFAKYRTPPAGRAVFSTDTSVPPTDPITGAIVAPVINFADYPLRAGGADVAATIGNMFAAQPSRENWQRIRDTLIEKTAIPENAVGKAISTLASAPGEAVAHGVRKASEAILGQKATDALSPYAQVAADIGLPLGGRAIGMVREATVPAAPHSPVRIGAAESVGSGYRLAPEQLNETPTTTGRLLSGWSGKYKKFDELSEINQRNTNRLAAEAIGLPGDTPLTDAAFERARGAAAAVYGELDRRVPAVVTAADPVFRAEARNVGRREEVLEREFPEAAENPEIRQLRESLLAEPTHSIEATRKQIADLRLSANKKFRTMGDAQAHAVGRAERQAADVLEHAIERSFAYGDPRISAMRELWAAEQDVRQAGRVLAGDRTATQPPGGMPAAQARLDQARRIVQQASIRDPAREAGARDLLERYRAARERFARTYDVELATNTANGDVSARRISGLRSGRLGRPLSGQLEQIANTYDDFPKALKDPAAFGHPEQWSVLDLYAAGSAFAGGHYGLGAITLGRPLGRRLMTSEGYQRRQLADRPPFPTPVTGGRIGTALMPHDDFDPFQNKMDAVLRQIQQRLQERQ